jgi:ribosome-binding protein aMBF1 (putative translation factor)
MKTIECSFCGKTAPTEVTPGKLVTGKEVSICRDCGELMFEAFARKDQRWRDRTLLSLRTVQAAGK